jgi:predicted N-acetyltransferase YhbS
LRVVSTPAAPSLPPSTLPGVEGAVLSIEHPRAAAREPLLAWLDAGLRGGRSGRLAAEYPTALADGGALHAVVRVAGAPVSHALARAVEVDLGTQCLRLGMVGLVYTEPRHRRRGLGAHCVRAATAALARARVPLVALWSERPEFYRRLGFEPAGRQWLQALDPTACRRAAGSLGAAPPDCVERVRPSDLEALERLYAVKPVRVRRAPGELARHAAGPDLDLLVARRGGAAVAYVACGRGDDFAGVAHEWAGDAAGVLACLEALARERGSITLLSGPAEEEPAARLRRVGPPARPGPFALLRLLDARALWAGLASGAALEKLQLEGAGAAEDRAPRFRLIAPETSIELSHGAALALCFGPELPSAALARLDAHQARALRARLPLPLFAWGFDSV